jgi:uncharacterized protein
VYFNISELLKQPVGVSQYHEVEESHLLTEDGTQSKVTGRLRLIRNDLGIWVKGELEAMVLGSCGRCLIDFCLTLPLHLREQYYPTVDLRSGPPLTKSRLADEDVALCILSKHNLDIREVVRQLIVTAVPMKPLCKSSCRGLCAKCGINLNEEFCQCQDSEEELGVSPLIGLLSKSAHPV